MWKKVALIFVAVFVVVSAGFLLLGSRQTATSPAAIPPVTQEPTVTPSTLGETSTQPVMEIDQKKTYRAIVHTTLGDITIALFADKMPITVNNFVSLARKNFYNDTVFHRAMKGFMIQGGDPKGDGTGGPGYRFADEPFEGEYTRGTVAMANAGPNTNGSQFFIMHQDYALSKDYVIFGKVASGLDVVDAIATSAVTRDSNSGENSKPVQPTVVTSITITEQ